MADNSEQRGFSVWIQLALVVLVILALVGLFVATGIFRQKGPTTHIVTYQVLGGSGAGVITYTKADGQSSGNSNVGLPWNLDLKMPSGTVVILTAGNPSQIGNLTCKLFLDGSEWKSQTANAPGDKISCAGIVP